MAACLAKAGHELLVKDANASVENEFAIKHGGKGINDNEKLEVDWVIMMLPNSSIVEDVILKHVDLISDSAVVIDMSSSEPLKTRELAEKLARQNIQMLDAPVSGGKVRAMSGNLSIMVGGEEEQYKLAKPVLDVMGESVLVGSIGAGHALKALNNYVSAAGLLAVVEALHVGEKFGLDPEIMTDVINNSTGQNNTTKNKVKQYMLSGNFDSAFSLGLMAKDLGIAVDLAEKMDEPMLLGHTCHDVWKGANEISPGADHTEMYRIV